MFGKEDSVTVEYVDNYYVAKSRSGVSTRGGTREEAVRNLEAKLKHHANRQYMQSNVVREKTSVNQDTVNELYDKVMVAIFDSAAQGYRSFDFRGYGAEPRLIEEVAMRLRELAYQVDTRGGRDLYVTWDWRLLDSFLE